MGAIMLQDTERKEIFDIVYEYRKAHLRLADNYKDKRAHTKCETCSRRAGHYLIVMKQSLYNAGQNMTGEDVKCFAVLVDSFEQMQKNRLLNELQKYADFDVVSYVGAYNRNMEKKNPFAKCVDVTDLSAKDIDKKIKQIRKARRKLKKNLNVSRNVNLHDVIHDEATELAHAVVNNKLKNNSKTYLKSVQKFLDVVFINDEDSVIENAKSLLEEKIKEPVVVGTVVDNILDGSEPKKRARTEPISIKDKPKTESKIKSVFGKIGGWFKSVAQKITDRREQRREEKRAESVRVAEVKEEKRKADAEKANLEKMLREQKAVRVDAERKARRDKRNMDFEQAKEVLGKTVSSVTGNVANGIGALTDAVKAKVKTVKEKHDTEKRNRQIIRDAERESKQHWKQIKKSQNQNAEQPKHKYFASGLIAVIAAGALFAGFLKMAVTAEKDYQNTKSVKKEVKAKPVVQKVTPVAIDTAYANALTNYYNSALDIIAGTKKDDVMRKINNQIKSGNVQTADYVGAERIAYAYFIYREYGFKIDVLELAVNGNQKLTDAQQAELMQVINDAGERGTGVQKQAKQRVESRGGSLSQHSKFKNATKQQQRQHLVNLGLLKKVQHVK